jgi:hypothetical protein
MSKKIIGVFHIIVLMLAGCNAMGTLFHGEKPEEPPIALLVVYSANGASGTVPNSQSVSSGSVITLPGKGDLTYSGNVFIGWNENQNGAGTTYPSGSSVAVDKDIIFYAQWISDSTPQYMVAFNANGATGGSVPISQTAYSGANIIIPGQGTLVFSGKNFAGWNTQAEGSGLFYSSGDPFGVTENTTFFAQWVDIPPEGTTTYTVNSIQSFIDAFGAINASSKDGTYIITMTGGYIL